MADRYVLGDTVTISNTFKVGTTPTNTTASLTVTEPGGSATTYTAGVLTNSTTGVYTLAVVCSTTGVWSYVWTGTGTVADVAANSFTVWPTTSSIDVLTLDEAKQALGLNSTDTNDDDYLRTLITAVSAQLDEMCGPVRTRTVTSELHDGGQHAILLRQRPVYSVTTVTEYDNITGTTLAAETNSAKTAANYLHLGESGSLASGRLVRRSNNTDDVFASGRRNVAVTYVAGRAANTDGVPAKFKQAAAMMLRNIWVAEAASGSETFGAFTESTPNPLLGPGRLNKVVAMLENELVDGIAVL